MWPRNTLLVHLLDEAYLLEDWHVIPNKEKHNMI